MFVLAGAMKLMQPKDKLQENMGWVENFEGTQNIPLAASKCWQPLALCSQAP